MSLIATYPTDLVLLGNRSYVHGTSLTYELLETSKYWLNDEVDRISAAILQPLVEKGIYHVYSDRESMRTSQKEFVTTFVVFGIKGSVYYVGVIGSGEKIEVRQPYDEDALTEGCIINKDLREAILPVSDSEKFLQKLLALNKQLHNTVFSREGFGQWFLARYDLSWIPTTKVLPISLIRIKIVSALGMQNTRVSVEIDGRPIGYIYSARKQSETI